MSLGIFELPKRCSFNIWSKYVFRKRAKIRGLILSILVSSGVFIIIFSIIILKEQFIIHHPYTPCFVPEKSFPQSKEVNFVPEERNAVCERLVFGVGEGNSVAGPALDNRCTCTPDSVYFPIDCSALLQHYILDALPEEQDFPIAYGVLSCFLLFPLT